MRFSILEGRTLSFGSSFRSRWTELLYIPDISGINMELSDKYHVKIENNNSIEFKVFERLE